jgi:hypothetical protein
MAWHQSHDVMDRLMVHPSNGEVWKHFNNVHSHFSAKSRNVRLGLCTNEFNPFGLFVAPYSCWSVILMIYNLLSGWVWGWSLCFYLWSYPVLIVWARIYIFVFDRWLMSWRSCGHLGLWLMMYRWKRIFS